MLTSLLIALFFVIVYFGLYCLIDLIDIKYKGNNTQARNNYAVTLLVKDVDEDLEHIIRTLKSTCTNDLTICNKIFIIDMDSKDQTPGILEKISWLDENIEVLRFEEKERIFEIFGSKAGGNF